MESSASSGRAPNKAETGCSAGYTPSAMGKPVGPIRVETLVVEIWPGVGARKPEPTEPRRLR